MKNKTDNTDARAAILAELSAIDTRLLAEREALKAEIATLAASVSKGEPEMKNYTNYNDYACALFEYKSNADKLTFARQRLTACNTPNGYPDNGRKLYADYKALNNRDRAALITDNRKYFEAVLSILDDLEALILEDHRAESLTRASFAYMELEQERNTKKARAALLKILEAASV